MNSKSGKVLSVNDKDCVVRVFIGPKSSRDKDLVKYSVYFGFSSYHAFEEHFKKYTCERDVLDRIYHRRDDIYALCGEDLSELLGVRAYNNLGRSIPIEYGEVHELTKEQETKIKKEVKQLVKSSEYMIRERKRNIEKRQNS